MTRFGGSFLVMHLFGSRSRFKAIYAFCGISCLWKSENADKAVVGDCRALKTKEGFLDDTKRRNRIKCMLW